MYFPTILLLLFYQITHHVLADFSGIISTSQNIIKRLENLTKINLDLESQFKAFSLEKEETMRLAKPVANLGFTLTKTVLESNERSLLKQLDEQITKFMDTSLHVYPKTSIVTDMTLSDYLLNIKVFLHSIRQDLTYLLDLENDNQLKETLAFFKPRCLSDTVSPWALLHKIDNFVSCNRTSKESIELYLEFKELAHKLISMIGGELDDELVLNEQYAFGIPYNIVINLWNGKSIVSDILQQLKNKKMRFNSIDEAALFLEMKIRERSSTIQYNHGQCLIDQFFASNYWKTEDSLYFGAYIEKDIQFLVLVGGFCAGIGYEENLEKKVEELKSLYEKVNEKVFIRTLELLDASWPNFDRQIIQRVLRDVLYTKMTKELIQSNASKIFDKLNKIGPSGYNKQVVVTAFGVEKDTFTLKCDPNYCTAFNSTKNKNGNYGIAGILIRSPNPEYYIRSTARWAELNRKKIKDLLLSHSSIPLNVDVIGAVEHELGPIITSNHSHGYLLVRDFHYFGINCVNWLAGVKYNEVYGFDNSYDGNKTSYKGVTQISTWTSGGIGSSAVCTCLYIFA